MTNNTRRAHSIVIRVDGTMIPSSFTMCASELLRHANRYHASMEHINDFGDSDCEGIVTRYADRERQRILARHGYSEDTFEAEFRSRVRYNYRMHNLLCLMTSM